MDDYTSSARQIDDDDIEAHTLGGTKAQMIQRLQVGLFGLGAMIMVIGLADIVMGRLSETEASAVPQAAPTISVETAPVAPSNPLAEAGVLPDIPAKPAPGPSAVPAPSSVAPANPTDADSADLPDTARQP